MGTRIVTFLGMGGPKSPYYSDCQYELDDHRSEPTPIHDVVTVLTAESPISLLVLGTKEVKERWFGKDHLYEVLLKKARCLPDILAFKELPKGVDEQERWQIFQTVVDALSPEACAWPDAANQVKKEREKPETIFLDITHGFRSQPFFAAAALSFAISQARRTGSHLPQLRIIYSMFEPGQEVTPVIDLTQLIDVLRFDSAIDGMMRHGKADELQQLLADLQKRLIGKGGEIPKLKALGNAAQCFCNGLATVRVPQLLTELAPKLGKTTELAAQDISRYVPPLEPQLKELMAWAEQISAAKVISNQGVEACFNLAAIYLKQQRFPELAAVLRETCVSIFSMEQHDNPLEPGMRGMRNNGFKEQRDADEKELTQKNSEGHHISEYFLNLGNDRNDMLHGGFREQPSKGDQLKKRLERRLIECKELQLKQQGVGISKVVQQGHFINCSNHHSTAWPAQQLTEARAMEYGEPLDIDFPHVDPEWTTDRVLDEARMLVQRIVDLDPAVVFITGEHTMTFAAVTLLQNRGIRCINSSAARMAKDSTSSDGSVEKNSRFVFRGWREYPQFC